jgi:hypothetical protein
LSSITILFAHYRSATFILTELYLKSIKFSDFFDFRMLLFMDLSQSPIIFFGDVTSQIQDGYRFSKSCAPDFLWCL